MSINQQPYVGTKVPDWMDPAKAEFPAKLGIYKGIVKQLDTGSRTSRVYVYIPEFGGNNQDLTSNWNAQVTYAGPFGGQTTGVLNQSGNSIVSRNDFFSTQQSYGFVASPPDLGSQVLCCFPNGNKMEGYWFAVINPNLSQNMIPAIGSVPLDLIDPVSVPPELLPLLTPGGYYPAGEFNSLSDAYNSDWTKTLKPLHVPQALNLIKQGLDQDPKRGAINSSLQRDPIGNVWGFSTPGRPYGNQDPANDLALRAKLLTGDFNPADYTVTTRVGGHSLVMDDGDVYGDNNLVRLKTSAGHQILMNDKDGFMYIANSSGTAWVELTKGGDILVYGKNDLSIRTEGHLMLHSDKNIHLNAGAAINMSAGTYIQSQAQAVQAFATQFLNLFGKNAQLASSGLVALSAASNMIVNAGGTVAINGGKIALNGSGGGGASSPPNPIPKYRVPNTINVGNKWGIVDQGLASINYKVPTHEPYIRGSVASVIAAQEEYARALANASTGGDSITDINGDVIQPETVTKTQGATDASALDVTKGAPSSSFIKQPDPGRGMGNLNNEQLRAYMAQTGYSESGGKYDIQNQYGYLGKYQLGSAALQDLGYVKPGTPQTPDALNNPNNWVGGPGKPASAAEFLASSTTQENAMYDYTRRNYAALQAKGVVTTDTPPDVTAGLLSASHLVGPGNAVKWYTSGQNVADANGTTASTYYNRGRYSQTQVPVITASTNSQSIGG